MIAVQDQQNLQVQIAVNLANQYLLTSFAGPDLRETDSATTNLELRLTSSVML